MNRATSPQSNFTEQMERIFSITGAKTQIALAEFLDVRPAFVSDARRRAKIPADWLITLARKLNANPEWVLVGKGDRCIELGEAGNAAGETLDRPEEESAGGPPSNPRGSEHEILTES